MNKMIRIKLPTIFITIIIIGVIILIISLKYKPEEVQFVEFYDENKKENVKVEYITKNGDTIFHGRLTTYNKKGNVTSIVNYFNGYAQGKSTYYFDNGNVETIIYRKGDIKLEGIWNYENGKIKSYAFYNPVGECAFTVDYKRDGIVENYRGRPMFEIYQYKFSHKEEFGVEEDQNLKVGDILKYQFMIAKIPNAKRSFKIENLTVSDDQKVIRTMGHIPPTTFEVQEKLIKKGKNTIRAIVKYEFTDKVTPTLIDTLSFDVMVN